MKNDKGSLLGTLPQIGAFLERDDMRAIRAEHGDGLAKFAIREIISETRSKILSGEIAKAPDNDTIASEAEKFIVRLKSASGRAAINATGILLHTGLGRAPLSKNATDSLSIFGGYSVLQADLDSGKRSLREEKAEKLICELCSCEAATVVNNNAAATLLVLNTLCEGKEAVISRGQLIEIGGQFRMPDVMDKSGAILKEVGTTNRTHLRDYEKAISDNTGAIIHVHTSNYRIRGFTGSPDIADLRKVADRHKGVALIDDIGSGALVPLRKYGIPDEPLVRDSMSAGADVACFSGDKLICGPQSGIICGRREIIARIRNNPFARMFRVCKLTLAALESTLLHFMNEDYEKEIPFYKMLSEDSGVVRRRAEKLSSALSECKNIKLQTAESLAYIGSGSAPDEGVKSYTIQVRSAETKDGSWCDRTAARMRNNIPAIFCRIEDDSLVFDIRTMSDDDHRRLVKELPEILSK
jgi:L-seryl-tRNA(Ser) seleniumtransferase